MRIGMVGLGRMGGNMAARLLERGHEVVVYDVDPAATDRAARAEGATAVRSLGDMMTALPSPRTAWVMVPAGPPTDESIAALAEHAEAGDILIDGGNTRFSDTVRRGHELAERGIHLLDAGTSGGVWGRENGYCLMVGGAAAPVAHCEPIFRALTAEGGFAHVGASGAGHFTKMVHNGIEYGLMQAYAEGFELLHASPFDIDLRSVAGLWNHGSVVRSWLLELLESAYASEGPELEDIRGWVEDSGEGRWTVETAIDLAVPAPVITQALFSRFRSRQDESYAAKVTSALRNAFGGHEVKRG
ncbi:MAG: decarboxylating 6-phosphogluconate dehydrogenase [Gemmatimonadota bacterium]